MSTNIILRECRENTECIPRRYKDNATRMLNEYQESTKIIPTE